MMPLSRKVMPLAIFTAFLMSFQEVRAQMDWIGPVTNGAIAGQVAESAMDNMGIPKNGKTVFHPRIASNRTINTFYVRSPQRTRQNLWNIAEQVKQRSLNGGLRLQKVIDTPQFIAFLDNQLTRYGLSVTNAADAWAFHWVNAWQAARVGRAALNVSTYKAVSRQIAGIFARTPLLASSSDVQRQELAENHLFQGVMIESVLTSTSSTPAQMQQLAKSARQSALNTGLNVDQVILTANGFMPVRR